MHKNNILSYTSPSFIGAGAPCPPPHRSMKAYIGTKEEIMMTWFLYEFLYVSLSISPFFLSFPFLSFPFLPFFGGGWASWPPWIRTWLWMIIYLQNGDTNLFPYAAQEFILELSTLQYTGVSLYD